MNKTNRQDEEQSSDETKSNGGAKRLRAKKELLAKRARAASGREKDGRSQQKCEQ
jgi:hypothetical protein